MALLGATMDFQSTPLGEEFIFKNPNALVRIPKYLYPNLLKRGNVAVDKVSISDL